MPPPLGAFVRRDNIHHRYYRRSGGGSDRSGKITLAVLVSAGGRIDLGGRIGGLDWIVVGGSSLWSTFPCDAFPVILLSIPDRLTLLLYLISMKSNRRPRCIIAESRYVIHVHSDSPLTEQPAFLSTMPMGQWKRGLLGRIY